MKRLLILLLVMFWFRGLLAAPVIPFFYPPFQSNKKALIAQGFQGVASHQGALNQYAIDLVLSEGEWVCAAAEGRVVDFYDGVEEMMPGVTFSNYVRIQDEAGRLQDYEHLLPGSIKVRIGALVKRGECFARVGNTGISTGPHLHFAVWEWHNNEWVSVPFQLVDPDGKVYTPRYLQWVRN